MSLASAAALSAMLAAAAQPDSGDLHPGFCAQLGGALEWANEDPPFRSRQWRPQAAGPFAWTCVLSGLGENRRLTCEWRAPPTTDLWQRLNGAIQRCLPRAIRMAEPEGTSDTARFRIGSFAIHTRHRNVGASAGSYVSYTVFRLPVHRKAEARLTRPPA